MPERPVGGMRLVWWFSITGALAPWIAGIGTKVYLDHLGQPTFSWSYFFGLEMIVIEILFSIWFAGPFLAFGLFARNRLLAASAGEQTRRARMIPIIFGFVCGFIGEIAVFVGIFWDFDLLMLFTPVPLFYAFFIVIGWVIGKGLVSFVGRRRTAD